MSNRYGRTRRNRRVTTSTIKPMPASFRITVTDWIDGKTVTGTVHRVFGGRRLAFEAGSVRTH